MPALSGTLSLTYTAGGGPSEADDPVESEYRVWRSLLRGEIQRIRRCKQNHADEAVVSN